jgi:hypothetical protein
VCGVLVDRGGREKEGGGGGGDHMETVAAPGILIFDQFDVPHGFEVVVLRSDHRPRETNDSTHR